MHEVRDGEPVLHHALEGAQSEEDLLAARHQSQDADHAVEQVLARAGVARLRQRMRIAVAVRADWQLAVLDVEIPRGIEAHPQRWLDRQQPPQVPVADVVEDHALAHGPRDFYELLEPRNGNRVDVHHVQLDQGRRRDSREQFHEFPKRGRPKAQLVAQVERELMAEDQPVALGQHHHVDFCPRDPLGEALLDGFEGVAVKAPAPDALVHLEEHLAATRGLLEYRPRMHCVHPPIVRLPLGEGSLEGEGRRYAARRNCTRLSLSVNAATSRCSSSAVAARSPAWLLTCATWALISSAEALTSSVLAVCSSPTSAMCDTAAATWPA